MSRREPDADKPRIGIGGLITKTQAFAPYVVDERMLGVAHARLGMPVRISMTHGIVTAPGYGCANVPFSQRQDQNVVHPYPIDAPMHITTLWMLTHAPADAGATLIASGSHRTHDNPAVAQVCAADAEIASQWWLDVTSMIPGLADYETRAEGHGYRPAEIRPLHDLSLIHI